MVAISAETPEPREPVAGTTPWLRKDRSLPRKYPIRTDDDDKLTKPHMWKPFLRNIFYGDISMEISLGAWEQKQWPFQQVISTSTSMPHTTPKSGADSESEDEDYVPPERQSSDSEDSPESQGRPSSVPAAESAHDLEEKKRKREVLWAEFQASVNNSVPEASATTVKTVKIEKRYRFAGDEVLEVVEVPEDSPEAKRWPLHSNPDTSSLPSAMPTVQPTAADTKLSATTPELLLSTTSSQMLSEDQPKSSHPPKPALKKCPGPRKSKITLASLPSSKAKKITTLDKSAMDWRAHIQAEEESGSSLKDDLEANRRAGGYLEKVEFLKRVEERKEENLGAVKPTKRRKL